MRYKVRKMFGPKPRHNVSGDYGVWDSQEDRWVLNATFINKPKAKRIAYVMNGHKK